MGKAWKLAEKEVSTALGGQRRVRIDYSESVEDVIHPRFAIEVKYGKQVPKYCCVAEPVILYDTKVGLVCDAYVLFPSKDIGWMLKGVKPNSEFMKSRSCRCGFIEAGIAQARAYNKDKVPVLCVKAKNMRNFVLVMQYGDWLAFEDL